MRHSPEKRASPVAIQDRHQQPDSSVDAAWLDEAERKLAAYREGRSNGIPAEAVVGKL